MQDLKPSCNADVILPNIVRLSQILVQKTKITKSHNSEKGSRISYHKIVQN